MFTLAALMVDKYLEGDCLPTTLCRIIAGVVYLSIEAVGTGCSFFVRGKSLNNFSPHKEEECQTFTDYKPPRSFSCCSRLKPRCLNALTPQRWLNISPIEPCGGRPLKVAGGRLSMPDTRIIAYCSDITSSLLPFKTKVLM
ncbi:unnamed protein product [Spodoptera exigua]|nr:unnamed protein product [Spodoptera exigua]